jgi:hypothetical protein
MTSPSGPDNEPGIPDSDLRLIAVMPLHAITTMYGEPGLRARFEIETKRLATPDDREKARKALQLAAQLHAQDVRQREPYINHPLRVALRILIRYDVADTDITCAGLLHDVVEDHAEDLAPSGRRGAFRELAARFGDRTAGLVEAVTSPPYVRGRGTWDEQYREHVAASLEACPEARVIKVSDFTDNGVGIIHTSGPKAVRLADKYAPLVPVLTDLINRPDTPLSPIAKAYIIGQLRAAGERFQAIAGQNTGSPVYNAGAARADQSAPGPGEDPRS